MVSAFNLKISILVVKVPQKTLLMDALKEETEIVYDFCMCNPPFFANQLEAKVWLCPPLFTPYTFLVPCLNLYMEKDI